MLTEVQIEGAEAERAAGVAKGLRMCCNLQFDVLPCTFRTEAEIWSQSGDTETCSLHLFDMLEDGENRVYVVDRGY